MKARTGWLPTVGGAAGIGLFLGAAEVVLRGSPAFEPPALAPRGAAFAGLVQAGAGLVFAGFCVVLGRLLLRRAPPGGLAWAAAGVAPLLAVGVRGAQRLLDAPVLSAPGLALTGGLGLLGLLAVAALARPAARLRARVGGAAVLGWLALGVAAVVGAPRRPAGRVADPVKNVVFVSVDSVRADDWRAYVEAGASPELRALLGTMRRFEEARTTWSHSLPSHASLLTGLWPARHGARVRHGAGGSVLGSPVRPEVPTLAERLRRAGLQTAAFVDNAWLGPPYGLERGFSTHANGVVLDRLGLLGPRLGLELGSTGAIAAYALGRLPGAPHATVQRALDWWGHRDPTRSAFLFVHFIEMHVPHDPPAAARARWARGPYADWSGSRLSAAVEAGELSAADPAVRAQFHALARASLEPVDRALVALFRGLEAAGGLDEALVVLVSDHGDDLYERAGTYGHAGVYEGVSRVVFAVRAPGLAPGRDARPVSLVDPAPTALAFLGLDAADLDGLDLLGSLPAERPLFTEGHDQGRRAGLPDHRAVVRGRWKLVATAASDGGLRESALYDLASDPEERRDLAAARPEVAAALRQRLEAYAAPLQAEPDDRLIGAEGLAPSVRAGLEALGYVEPAER